MIYLLLSVLFTSAIFLIFKLFEKYHIDTFFAIVVNYLVAACFGWYLLPALPSVDAVVKAAWFANALITGTAFIGLFFLMAVTAQKMGVGVASTANKMSVIFPVVFAFLFYGDSMGVQKITGIALALLGIYLTVAKPHEALDKKRIALPLVVFVGSGLLDIYLKHTQSQVLDEQHTIYFIPLVFLMAFLIGFAVLLVSFFTHQRKFKFNTLIGGAGLGIVNYASIYFLFKTLAVPNFQSSVIFPLNNMGVVAISTLLAFLIFKEKLSISNWMGMVIAVLAIALIAFA